MKLLGLLLLLFGIAVVAVPRLMPDVKVFEWTNNWGDAAYWGIVGGSILLGLVLLASGGGKKPKKG